MRTVIKKQNQKLELRIVMEEKNKGIGEDRKKGIRVGRNEEKKEEGKKGMKELKNN